MEYIKIKDILEFKKKSKIKASEGLKRGKYNFYTSSKEQNKFLDYYEYSNESIIIGTGGNANIHHSYGKFSVSTDCFVLENKAKEYFLLEYIYRYLLKNIHILENGFRGAGLKHISKEYLENIEVPIISLEKQKKLIKILENIDIFIGKNKQIKTELKFLNKSLFTRMFGDIKTNDKNWEIKKLKELVEIKSYRINENLDSIWLLNLEDIEPNTGKLIRKREISFENIPNSTISFNEDYILYSKLRPYLNKVFLPYEKGVGTSELVPLLPKKIINKIFLVEYLRNDKVVDFLSQKVSGAKMPHIIMKEFQDLNLIVPSIELQNKFAERVEKIEKLSFEIEKSIKEAENLYNSLMNKYFD